MGYTNKIWLINDWLIVIQACDPLLFGNREDGGCFETGRYHTFSEWGDKDEISSTENYSFILVKSQNGFALDVWNNTDPCWTGLVCASSWLIEWLQFKFIVCDNRRAGTINTDHKAK